MNEKLLLVKINQNGVADIILNRPEIHNAFNDQLISELTSEFIKLDQDINVRIITITGAGKSFCAGADLNWMKSMVNYDMDENIADSQKLYQMFNVINKVGKPVLAKVNGHALGGGVGLLAVSDFVLASDHLKLGFTEVKLGLIPAVISPFCIAKIGESNARAWFLSGNTFSSLEGQRMGLVHKVVSKEDLDIEFKNLVDSFLQAGPEAAKEAKSLISNVMEKTSSEMKNYTSTMIASRRVSKEGQEGMSALLEKRKAKWVNND